MNFTQYLTNAGVSPTLLYLVLALPFVTLIVSFLRYFIGIKTFGIYEPVVISFALFAISPFLLEGLKIGLPLLFIAWLVSEVSNNLLARIRMHYISKVSLRVSMAALFIILALYGAVYFGLKQYYGIDPLVLVIFLTLVETISLFQYKKGASQTNLISIETLVVTLVSYALLTWGFFRDLLMVSPYLVVIPLIFNVIVGRWTGLRLVELIRFKDITKND